MNLLSTTPDQEPVRLGLLLTAIQIAVYAGFILLCCFRVPLLRLDSLLGVPLSFALGFGVILCGVVLTAIYVVVANCQKGR